MESFLAIKNGFKRTYYTFRILQKLSEFPPFNFLRAGALARVGCRSGSNRVNGKKLLSTILQVPSGNF